MDGLPKLFNSTKGLSAAIYTQISDVEAEVNGELTPFMQELLQQRHLAFISIGKYNVESNSVHLHDTSLKD